MRFTFDGWKADQSGNLTANGVGFRYQYNKERNLLRILSRYNNTLYKELPLRSHCTEEPFILSAHIEKVSQIKALNLSGNQTVNLIGTLESSRVALILGSVVKLARYSFWLEQGHYDCFSRGIIKNYFLNGFYIRKITKPVDPDDLFYNVEIQTLNGHSTKVSADNLHHAISSIAQSTVRDLVVREYHMGKSGDAQELMNLSTQLCFISKTLDCTFVPRQRIVPRNPFKELFNRGIQHEERALSDSI